MGILAKELRNKQQVEKIKSNKKEDQYKQRVYYLS